MVIDSTKCRNSTTTLFNCKDNNKMFAVNIRQCEVCYNKKPLKYNFLDSFGIILGKVDDFLSWRVIFNASKSKGLKATSWVHSFCFISNRL